jgi:hypothetical protein
MDRDHILAEIRRTARENGGKPLGRQRFFAETGIKQSHWCGIYWARWRDAVAEAGYEPNKLQGAYNERVLLQHYADLIRELGRFPVSAEVRLKARNDRAFPSASVFEQRFGSQKRLAAQLLRYAQEQGLTDIASICEPLAAGVALDDGQTRHQAQAEDGFVYLVRSGRHFKIGRTNSTGRRERELQIQLPERAKLVHSIKTDDPAGIESYWHQRFVDKRENGEWFTLSASDVAAFRRRKFM